MPKKTKPRAAKAAKDARRRTLSDRSDRPRRTDAGRRDERPEQRTNSGYPRARRFDDRRDDRRDDRGSAGREFGNDRGERRDDRRPYGNDDRGQRRSFGRDDRRPFRRDDRDDRRPYSRDDRDDRRPYSRDDRDERRPWGRDDRGQRRSFGRDDRKPFRRDDRDDRRGFDRDDRRPFRRDDRDDQRPNRFDRDDRRSFQRDDRGDRPFNREERDGRSFKSRDDREKRGYGNRDDRRRPSGPRAGRPERDTPRPERRSKWQDSERRGRDRRDERPEADDDYADSDLMAWEPSEAPVGQVDVPEGTGFAELGVPAKLVKVLAAKEITKPFPIQAATIPDALGGAHLLGRGQTGSGKTLAFGLPMIIRLAKGESSGKPRGLILTPTRELAMQVADVISSLAAAMGLKTLLVAGGMPYPPQLRALQRGVDIIVATPGRLIDLMEQEAADLTQVEVSVLDEADLMADMGFLPEVTRLLDQVSSDAQHLLFSATLDDDVDQVVQRYLTDPVVHGVDPERASVSTMSHLVWHVLPKDKVDMIANATNREGRTMVFVRTQLGADRVAGQLRDRGIMAGALHGGLTQGARARVMRAFRNGDVPVLVATDVAARGIHVDDVSLVLQADIPHDSKDYLHRSGRTARAGEKGAVASIVLPHERRRMARITDQAGVHADPRRVSPGEDSVVEVTGGTLPTHDAEPIADERYQELIAPRPTPPKKRGRSSFGDRPGNRRSGGGQRGRRQRWES